MDHVGFAYDVSRCSGCMACVVACMDQNDFKAEGPSFRQVISYEKGQYPSAKITYFSLSCMHCGEAPCMNVCPTDAIGKAEDLGCVFVNRDQCMGCHSCAMVCPFGAIQFTRDGKMGKCDLCMNRLEHGMDPACVRTCPTRALEVGAFEVLSKHKAEKASISILQSLTSPGGLML